MHLKSFTILYSCRHNHSTLFQRQLASNEPISTVLLIRVVIKQSATYFNASNCTMATSTNKVYSYFIREHVAGTHETTTPLILRIRKYKFGKLIIIMNTKRPAMRD